MRFAVSLPSYAFRDLDFATCARLREFCVRAERLGYEGLWVPEHLLTAPGLYGTAWLSPLDYDLEQLELWQDEIVRHLPG